MIHVHLALSQTSLVEPAYPAQQTTFRGLVHQTVRLALQASMPPFRQTLARIALLELRRYLVSLVHLACLVIMHPMQELRLVCCVLLEPTNPLQVKALALAVQLVPLPTPLD